MKFSSVIFGAAAFLAAVCNGEEPTTEEGVYVLGDSTFNDFIGAHEFVLAEFYAPWCGHCKSLAPEYAKAAQQLESSGSLAKLAKIDATEHKEVAGNYDVKGFPTLKFFRSGSPVEYTGGRTAADIVAWISKKTGPPATTLKTEEEFTALKEEQDAIVVGFFDDFEGAAAKEFLNAANGNDGFIFAMTSNGKVRKAAEVNEKDDSIVIFKKYDEERAVFNGKMAVKDIEEFIESSYLPNVMAFNEVNQPKIFGGKIKSHNLLFGNAKDIESVSKCYNEVAKKFKTKLMFITVDISSPTVEQILQFFKISKDSPLTIRIINISEDIVKYAFDGKVTCDVFGPYVQNYIDGKLSPFLASAPLPENWDAEPVKVLVQENFAAVALNPKAFTFVEFYAPWCGHCKALAPIWEQLAKAFAAYPEITIAKIDSTENELQDYPVQGFPTLRFFKKGELVEFSKERNFEDLKNFVEEQTGLKAAEVESEEDEDEEDEDEDTNDAVHEEL